MVDMNSRSNPMPFLLLALTLLITAVPVVAQTDGAFTLRQASRDGRLNLNLQYEDGHSNYGRNFERSAFSDVKQSGDRITFALRRAPGVFTFEGRGSMERASGWYDFAPSSDFQREIERIGFRGVDDKALFVFALDDLTVEKIQHLQGLLADRIDTEQLVRLINHGAGLTYVQSMTQAGFKKLSADEYRRARDHGVTAEYAREMGSLGTNLALEDLVRTRDHGVTIEYAKAMRDAGYDLGIDELVRARDHGVTTEYVKAMRSAGHKVDIEEMVRARDHGVTADFIRRMGELGYGGLPLEDYVRMRDHGVTPDFVESMRDAGLTKIAARDLVKLRDHGISASYVRRAKEIFKETPTVDQIIRLRTRGDIGG
jgi:hypothetical protein